MCQWFFSKKSIVTGFDVVELLTSVSPRRYYNYVLELIASEQYSLPYYKMCCLECTKIALWPLLYITEEWCENKVKGQVNFFVSCVIDQPICHITMFKYIEYCCFFQFITRFIVLQKVFTIYYNNKNFFWSKLIVSKANCFTCNEKLATNY